MATTVRGRLTGAVYHIRSKYLIGAGGARSEVAEDTVIIGPGREITDIWCRISQRSP